MDVDTTGPFPNDDVLVKLLQFAKLTTEQIVHDAYGFDKTYAELLGDVLQTRDALRTNLPPTALTAQGLLCQERPYICVLTRSGYEFLVAFFAIRALGGAAIPLGECVADMTGLDTKPTIFDLTDGVEHNNEWHLEVVVRQLINSPSTASGILPDEAEYFMSDAQATCLLAGESRIEQARNISRRADFITLPISNDAQPVRAVDIGIDETLPVDARSPGYVVFTSGSTGPPKGAVLPKNCLAYMCEKAAAPGSASISFRPPHWLGGAGSLITAPLTGTKLYILKERASAEDIWQVFKCRRITQASFTPGLLRQMKEVYTDQFSSLPAEERQKYLDGFKNLAKISCGGAMISSKVLKFWTSVSERPFEQSYASTEGGGAMIQTKAGEPTKAEHAIGTPVPGVHVKLSEGDHGEILIKSPWMLTHYIGDEEATKAAFDEQGHLKTGDLAHIVDGEYVYDGRASIDYVFFHGYRIQSIRVEEALRNLPYVGEAYVVGVPDHEAKQLCGALIRIAKGTAARQDVSLARIHADLADALPAYMRPYLLRVLDDGDEVPYTVSTKPKKREIVHRFFVSTGCKYWSVEDPTPGVEAWGSLQPAQCEAETKPWDWCGRQRSD